VPARYIVLGLRVEAEEWRHERGLSRRDVVHVSTRSALALRGLSGQFEVVTLPSWELASQRVRTEVERNLAIVAATNVSR
jgi:hypothetical protein